MHLLPTHEPRGSDSTRVRFALALERLRRRRFAFRVARRTVPLPPRYGNEFRTQAIHVVPAVAPVAKHQVGWVVAEATGCADGGVQQFCVFQGGVVVFFIFIFREIGIGIVQVFLSRRRRAPRANGTPGRNTVFHGIAVQVVKLLTVGSVRGNTSTSSSSTSTHTKSAFSTATCPTEPNRVGLGVGVISRNGAIRPVDLRRVRVVFVSPGFCFSVTTAA
jgi:hypothetical protein